MEVSDALDILVNFYNIKKEVLLEFLNNNKKIENYDNIIMPFMGKIYEDRCKGIIFNHGLYTQCCEKTSLRFCKVCEKQKYGSIYDREKYELGKYVSNTGKKELSYDVFIKKMKYNIDDVKKCFIANGFDYSKIMEDKKTNKSRGRPRKENSINTTENDEECMIEVVEVEYMGKLYYKSIDGVLMEKDSYEIIGILKDSKLEKIGKI